jgi:hypothetical protein
MKIEAVELVVTTDIGVVRIDIPWNIPGLVILDMSIGQMLNEQLTKLIEEANTCS